MNCTNKPLSLLFILSVGLITCQQVVAQDAEADKAQIEAAVVSYAAAFNNKDVNKLISHWSPEGVYVSRSSGEKTVGREAISATFSAILGSDDTPQIALATESIEFISPNVALERGTCTVTTAQEATESRYRVVYIKKDGTWLIDRVTEEDVAETPSRYERLKGLEWLVGDWDHSGEGFSVEFNCQWTRNKNFISRKFKVIEGDSVSSSGLQIIGWDAESNRIRSWLFDSDGGFISGTWTQRDDRWIVQSTATLADGGKGSFRSVFRPLDESSYAWKKTNRIVDGELLPNIDEIIVNRK